MPTRWVVAWGVVLLAVLSAGAAKPLPIPPDPTLISLDTPSVQDRGRFAARADIRVFGAKEDLIYGGFGLHYGVGAGFEAIARGVFAGRETLALPGGGSLRHGGGDLELLAKYQPPGMPYLAGLVGVAYPMTPAQDGVSVTLGLSAAYRPIQQITGYLNPRVVFIDGNTLVTLGVGLRGEITPQLALLGEWLPSVAGDNTRNTGTGALDSLDVWGAAVRFGPFGREARVSLDLGFTNGTGTTTGSSLTPGLGGSGALYAAVNGSF